MRVIKFRGMATGNKFVYGFYVQVAVTANSRIATHAIQPAGKYAIEVHSKTVGQFTGIHDKNGVPVFEGDILSDHVGIGVVEYSEKRASFRANYKDGTCKWFIDYNLKGELESIEVVGNIHQHAHLL